MSCFFSPSHEHLLPLPPPLASHEPPPPPLSSHLLPSSSSLGDLFSFLSFGGKREEFLEQLLSSRNRSRSRSGKKRYSYEECSSSSSDAKKIFSTGFSAILSSAMLYCAFYSSAFEKSKFYGFDKKGNWWKERTAGTVKFPKNKVTSKNKSIAESSSLVRKQNVWLRNPFASVSMGEEKPFDFLRTLFDCRCHRGHCCFTDLRSNRGDYIKEGQVIGYLDQFGTSLPVKPHKFHCIRAQASGSTKIEGIPEKTDSNDDNLVFVAGATGRVGSRTVRELIKHGFKVRARVRSVEKAGPLFKVAELMAVVAKNPDLAYCKIVEVVAETTAPLTPTEELLAKISSQRPYISSPKKSDATAISDSAPSKPAIAHSY
ncbi:Protein TIC 62 [Arachis hypogaea]|nr:Protein TIC 62 [Arachis hypogaea]